MNKLIAVLLTLLFLPQTQAYDYGNAFKAVDKLFLAISDVNHNSMKTTVTDNFVLLEHGEVWSIDDLIKVVVKTDYARDNYFSIISMKDHGKVVTVNYWNKAKFHNPNYNETVIWLESAVIEKIKGKWLVSQLHSTRLPPGITPKDAVFTKQININQ